MKARVALTVAILMVGGLQAAAAAPRAHARLAKIGRPAFWHSNVARPVAEPTFHPEPVVGPVLSEADAAQGKQQYRWDYFVDVAAPAHRLRIALDAPSAYEWHYMILHGPAGAWMERGGFNSIEIDYPDPPHGLWRIVVISATDKADFRFRGILEAAPKRSAKRVLLPNLQLIPPFEFTFANPYRGTFRFQGAGAVPAPDGTANCWWDEVVEHGARKCLRFSLGPVNTGAGPLRLVFEGNGAGVVQPGAVTQLIPYTDGSVIERFAGNSEFHKTHMHYHHTGFGTLELLKVTDARRGTMIPAGAGPKQGFCTADVVLYQWTRFAGTQNEASSECLNDMQQFGTFAPTGTGMGISPGWGDIYDWSQSGNYVEFGDNGDGRYVVRSTADASGWVMESNEKDNTSYAYIEITGASIKVLERGFGQSPWDRKKVRANDLLRATPSGFTS